MDHGLWLGSRLSLNNFWDSHLENWFHRLYRTAKAINYTETLLCILRMQANQWPAAPTEPSLNTVCDCGSNIGSVSPTSSGSRPELFVCARASHVRASYSIIRHRHVLSVVVHCCYAMLLAAGGIPVLSGVIGGIRTPSSYKYMRGAVVRALSSVSLSEEHRTNPRVASASLLRWFLLDGNRVGLLGPWTGMH